MLKFKQSYKILLFVLLSFAVFSPLLFTKLYWDDVSLLFNQVNQYQLNLNALKFFGINKESYSWPIFYLFFSLLVKIFGNQYFYYRLFILLLHGINAYLFWKILRKIKIRNHLLISVVFLIHPYHLLTLSLIIQIKTLLAVFFLLLSIKYIFNFYNTKNQILAFIFYILSLLSKSITLSFLPLYLFFLYKRKKSRKSILLIISLVSLAFFSFLRTIWDATSQRFIYDSIIGNWYNDSTIFIKYLISIKNFIKYFYLGFFPIRINYLYQPPTEISKSFFEYFVVLIPLLLILFIFNNFSRDKKYKLLFLFFCINIIPLCGLFFIPIFATSNFVTYWYYLPLLGLLPIISYFIKNVKFFYLYIIIFSIYSHLTAYTYIKTENIILNSVKATPDSINMKLALLDFYHYNFKCTDYQLLYRQVFDGNISDNDNIIKNNYSKKLHACRVNYEH